jgi:hypothetical protein
MKQVIISILLFLVGGAAMADLGHADDAKKVEVAVFKHMPMDDAPNWTALKSEIYNTFDVPITLREIRIEGASVKVEKATTLLGVTVWKELNFLQISGGGLIEFDSETYRMRINFNPKAGASIQLGFDFGPIGWKSYFYNTPKSN